MVNKTMKTMTMNGETYEITDEKARVEFEKLKKDIKPFLLDADMLASYNTDPQYGDAALQAILDGRQILVKTPNRDGGKTVCNYSPVYFYQLPNENCDHLWLFYLRDEKQTLDLSAMGLDPIELPIQADLKMCLSKEYTECPLK